MNEDPVLSTQLFYRPESALKKESTHLTKSLVQKVKSSVYQKATFKQWNASRENIFITYTWNA